MDKAGVDIATPKQTSTGRTMTWALMLFLYGVTTIPRTRPAPSVCSPSVVLCPLISGKVDDRTVRRLSPSPARPFPYIARKVDDTIRRDTAKPCLERRREKAR